MSLRVTKKQWILIAGWAAIGIIGAVLNTLMMQPTIHERFRQNPGYRSYVQHRTSALNPMFSCSIWSSLEYCWWGRFALRHPSNRSP